MIRKLLCWMGWHFPVKYREPGELWTNPAVYYACVYCKRHL